ncbi:MAG: hypothetical protein M1840_004609 [Geoglossum simile]|nr:MAG: hypothetical protein M1840_004609 [Geoglossum simile]
MVVFVDLEDLGALSVEDDVVQGPAGSSLFLEHRFAASNDKLGMGEEAGRAQEPGEELVKKTPNRGNFSAALASYP